MWKEIDVHILMSVNLAHHQVLDVFMAIISNKFSWIWLYFFILGMSFRKLGPRFIFFLLFAALTFASTDLISVHGFKEVFQRLRPCHSPELMGYLHRVVPCGGKFGFVSSHAANTAGIAAFTWYSGVLHYHMPVARKFFFSALLALYVLLNAYARVYLGVHYPSDVVAGLCLGMSLGLGVGWLWKNTVEKPTKERLRSPKQPLLRK